MQYRKKNFAHQVLLRIDAADCLVADTPSKVHQTGGSLPAKASRLSRDGFTMVLASP
jgi:hypothetical protein